MDTRLQDTIIDAANAFARMADEAEKLSRELLALQARVDQQDNFNKKLKMIFDEYYGG